MIPIVQFQGICNSFCVCTTDVMLCLDASDDLLKDRVINLPEKLVQELHYEQEHFLRRLASYRQKSLEEETVVHYFDEMGVSPLYLGNSSGVTVLIYKFILAEQLAINTNFRSEKT